MDRIIKTKGAWNWWSVTLQVTKQVQKIILLVMYYQTKFDDVIYSGFELLQKLYQ